LRGLAEPLNQPAGAGLYPQLPGRAGDGRCRFDLTQPGYIPNGRSKLVDDGHQCSAFAGFAGFDDRWFEFGRLEVLTGAAAGLSRVVKSTGSSGAMRRIELWQSLRAPLAPGDGCAFAGCDKRRDLPGEVCNLLNFRGFPHLPGEDWLAAYPRPGQGNRRLLVGRGLAT
jgi:uncharacterized phage protein (TIGR02218 family)